MAHAFDASTLGAIVDLSGSLSQRVYHALREAILSLALPPGSVLRKSLICEQLGVSRSPVSEAIARLAGEGLVDVIPQSGTRVSSFSMDEIREASFIREALESAAAAKLASQHTPEQLQQLTRIVRLQQILVEDGDYPGSYKADEDFHATLMELTGFPGLAQTVATISMKLKRPRILLLPEPGRPFEAVREHLAIIDAIRDGDPDAARTAMNFHLCQLLSRFEPLEQQYPDYFRTGGGRTV